MTGVSSQETNILGWHDLSADEVYYVAHLENEVRQQASTILARAAFTSNFDLVNNVQKVIQNNEVRSEAWLTDQALLRGMVTTNLTESRSDQKQNGSDFNSWFAALLTETPEYSQRNLAEDIGVSESYVSMLRHEPSKRLSKSNAIKMVHAVADARKLEREERKLFVETNLAKVDLLFTTSKSVK